MKKPRHWRGHFYTYEDYPILFMCFRRFLFHLSSISTFVYYIRQGVYHANPVAMPKQGTQLNNHPQSTNSQQIATQNRTMKINRIKQTAQRRNT
jgi:hypothetical protein